MTFHLTFDKGGETYKVVKSPCYLCQERTVEPNCHNAAICSKWGEYIEKCEAEKEQRIKEREQARADAQRRWRLKNQALAARRHK